MSSTLVPRRRFLSASRHALVMLALTAGIAVLVTIIGRGSFGLNFAYSLCIGSACWLCIDGGRHLVAWSLRRWRVAHGHAPGAAAERWPGWGWMSLCIAVGLPLGVTLGMALADRLMGSRSPSLLDWRSPSVQATVVISILATAVMVAVINALERATMARVEAEAAERLAAENRLRLLESQLEPHMLFNTLANLRVLISVDPPRAQQMLDHMIAFLRATLGASRTSLHSLQAEFARLDDYLALMAVRMGARLDVRLDLPAALRDVPVPALLLQPLVENAIKHGLEPKIEGGRIEVSAASAGAQLLLAVRDTGVGIGTAPTATSLRAAPAGTGFGCTQVRERLRTLYGNAASLSIEPHAEGGTLARIRLPLA